MMFATLDDVEGQVEMLVFKADEAESAGAIESDAVVLVRGRIDHKERGETKLVVQEAERFEPDGEEIAQAAAAAAKPAEPLRLAVDATKFGNPDSLVDELRALFEHHRGDAAVSLILNRDGEPSELRLGDEIRVRPSSLRAELGHVPGVEIMGADALAA
jgi:DNA polymerase-3 subunit alpha